MVKVCNKDYSLALSLCIQTFADLIALIDVEKQKTLVIELECMAGMQQTIFFQRKSARSNFDFRFGTKILIKHNNSTRFLIYILIHMYIIKLIHIYTYIYTYIHTHTSTRGYVNICIRPHEVPCQVTLNRQKG
jgi:hypothetical protein